MRSQVEPLARACPWDSGAPGTGDSSSGTGGRLSGTTPHQQGHSQDRPADTSTAASARLSEEFPFRPGKRHTEDGP